MILHCMTIGHCILLWMSLRSMESISKRYPAGIAIAFVCRLGIGISDGPIYPVPVRLKAILVPTPKLSGAIPKTL